MSRRNRLVSSVKCQVSGGWVSGVRCQVLAILGLFIICFPLTGCFSQNPGVIKDDQKAIEDIYTHDFGTVKEGEVVQYSFEFKNGTGKVLNIKSVDTSCGCTSSEVKTKKLSPGESTFIDVKFNSKGYPDQRQVTQYVYVNTDDIDNPVVRYIIKAFVVK